MSNNCKYILIIKVQKLLVEKVGDIKYSQIYASFYTTDNI